MENQTITKEKEQQAKTLYEEIDSILNANAKQKYHDNSVPEQIQRLADKIDTFNKLFAFALKQKYGRQQ